MEEVPNIKQIFGFLSSDWFVTDKTYQEVVCKRKAQLQKLLEQRAEE